MAEGGKLPRSFLDSFSKASGDADESFCDPCKSVGEWIAVEGFCPVCDEYLCEHCLIVHRKQKITRAHAIMDKNQMPSRQGSAGIQDMCVELCKTHHPEIIRFYCKAHDEPGCGDCMTLEHTACQKDRVQDISSGFEKTKEFEDIEQQLQQLHQALEEIDSELGYKFKNLDKTYKHILQKIESIRKQINEYVDQIKKKITDEAVQMKKEDETELNNMQAENLAMKNEIEVMLKTLHNSKANVNSLFVTTKNAKHRLVTMETEIQKIQQSQQQQQQQQYEFHISDDIENIVSNKTPLGKLSRRSSQKQKEMTKKQHQKMPRAPTIDTSATYNRSINGKGLTDKKPCYITSCSLLNPDRMVVTDMENENVKLIDISNNTVISSYSTHTPPWSVTALTSNMIAVTLCNERKIQILQVASTITLQREIPVDKACFGIAYKDEKFAVSYTDPGSVDILDIHGKILHTIQPKQGEDYILQDPHYLTFGHDNDTVIVSDFTNSKVCVVTFSGKIVNTYTHDRLKYPYGMVITGNGVLFVCSYVGQCIHVVSPDFKTSKIIINKEKYVVFPQSITYCDINHRLYISNTDKGTGGVHDQIQVYNLEVPE